MKLLLCCIIAIFSLSGAVGQPNDADQITQATALAQEYMRKNPDSARYFAQNALILSVDIADSQNIAAAYNLIGNTFFIQSAYDSAIYYFSQCLGYAEKLRDTLRLGAMYNNMGQLYSYKAEQDTAIYLLLQAMTYYAAVDSSRVSSPLNNLGNTYCAMDDLSQALVYYLEAARVKEKYDQEQSLSNTLNNIGIIYRRTGENEKAIPYYERSLAIAEKYNDISKQANAHNNLAIIYDAIPDIKLAEFHYLKSIQLKRTIGDQIGLYNGLSNFASFLSGQDRAQEALAYVEEADQVGATIGTNVFTADAEKRKAIIYFNAGKEEEGFETLLNAYQMKIDEVNADRNEKIAEWESRFEKATQDAAIAQLQLTTSLQEVQLKNNRIMLFAILSSFALLVLILIIYFRQKSKRLQAEREAQELQVEALQKRLRDLKVPVHEDELDMAALNDKLQDKLSEREFEVLQKSIQGKTNAEIGDTLFISISTVKFHLRNTYSKLGVSNRKEALQYVTRT